MTLRETRYRIFSYGCCCYPILLKGQEAGMKRRAKGELFEEIRREYEFGIGTVRGVARKLGVHRRQVRQALADAQPPARKQPQPCPPVLARPMPFIDASPTID